MLFYSQERRARSRPWLLNVRNVRRNARRRRRSRRGSRRKRRGRKQRRSSLRCRSKRRIQLTVTFFMTFAASEETAELVFSNTFILHYKVQDESGW